MGTRFFIERHCFGVFVFVSEDLVSFDDGDPFILTTLVNQDGDDLGIVFIDDDTAEAIYVLCVQADRVLRRRLPLLKGPCMTPPLDTNNEGYTAQFVLRRCRREIEKAVLPHEWEMWIVRSLLAGYEAQRQPDEDTTTATTKS